MNNKTRDSTKPKKISSLAEFPMKRLYEQLFEWPGRGPNFDASDQIGPVPPPLPDVTRPLPVC